MGPILPRSKGAIANSPTIEISSFPTVTLTEIASTVPRVRCADQALILIECSGYEYMSETWHLALVWAPKS